MRGYSAGGSHATGRRSHAASSWSHEERGVRQVIRTGQPQLLVEISDEMLAASGRDADHVRLLREIGLRSAIVVPMRAHDKVLGTITLGMVRSGRYYGPSDLKLAEYNNQEPHVLHIESMVRTSGHPTSR